MTMKAATLLFALLALALLVVAPADATRPCGDAVVSDWADGHIDGRYAPRCYGDALETLPEDVRAYSTAEDDIARAMRAQIRKSRERTSARGSESSATGGVASVPIPLVSGAALALVLALAALVHLVGHRLRRERPAHRATRPIGQW